MKWLALGAALLVGGCATGPKIADSSCRSFEPIRASTKDTVETKRQVLKHNKAWVAVCG